MRIAVTGSIAYDYLMKFPGHFQEHLLAERSHRLTVSFLVESLQRMNGGVAGNIAYTLALLGDAPLMIGAAGHDFPPYGERLAKLGVDVSGVTQFPDELTGSCFINTDLSNSQIVTFYAGAMARSRELALSGRGLGPGDLAVISPTDPEVMMRYVSECAADRIPYVFDPGKQTPRLEASQILRGLETAQVMVSNDYEFALMAQKTGRPESELSRKAPLTVITRGDAGASILPRDGEEIRIPVAKIGEMVDPTGAGDAFLGGLVFGLKHELPLPITGRVGALAGAWAVESRGCQEHHFTPAEFLARYESDFGKCPELERAFASGPSKGR